MLAHSSTPGVHSKGHPDLVTRRCAAISMLGHSSAKLHVSCTGQPSAQDCPHYAACLMGSPITTACWFFCPHLVHPPQMPAFVLCRVNCSALCIFITLWHLVVYCPLAHMVWYPTGLIKMFGVLDYAGQWRASAGPCSPAIILNCL